MTIKYGIPDQIGVGLPIFQKNLYKTLIHLNVNVRFIQIHWIDELDDFRHVRIDFTPEERSDFVRRCWAYELFLRTNVEWASEVPGIDHDIAQEVDAILRFSD